MTPHQLSLLLELDRMIAAERDSYRRSRLRALREEATAMFAERKIEPAEQREAEA